jgi:hypothetical protein
MYDSCWGIRRACRSRRLAVVGKTLMEGGELYETDASGHLAFGRACDEN